MAWASGESGWGRGVVGWEGRGRWGDSYTRTVFNSVPFHLVKNHKAVCNGKALLAALMPFSRDLLTYGAIHEREHYTVR